MEDNIIHIEIRGLGDKTAFSYNINSDTFQWRENVLKVLTVVQKEEWEQHIRKTFLQPKENNRSSSTS